MNIYVLRGREQQGPFTLAEVNTRLAADSLDSSDLALPDGSTQWVRLSAVPGVKIEPDWQMLRELDAAMQANHRILRRRDQADRVVHSVALAAIGDLILLGAAILLSQESGRGGWAALCLLATVLWTVVAMYAGTRAEPPLPSFRPVYAGFWLRFAAYLVDTLILYVPHMIVVAPAVRYAQTAPTWNSAIQPLNMVVLGLETAALDASLYWLYFAIAESSAWQATVGKRLLGIKVVDLQGKPISFGRASGRFFAKLLSAAPLMLGYVMAAFTDDEQALHDLIARTLVVKKEVGKSLP